MTDLESWADAWIASINRWGRAERDRARGAIAPFVAEDIQVAAPGVTMSGLDDYVDQMATYLTSLGPEATFVRVGPVDAHNGWVRFPWRIIDASVRFSGPLMGTDIAQLDESGKAAVNVVFHDTPR